MLVFASWSKLLVIRRSEKTLRSSSQRFTLDKLIVGTRELYTMESEVDLYSMYSMYIVLAAGETTLTSLSI